GPLGGRLGALRTLPGHGWEKCGENDSDRRYQPPPRQPARGDAGWQRGAPLGASKWTDQFNAIREGGRKRAPRSDEEALLVNVSLTGQRGGRGRRKMRWEGESGGYQRG